MFIKILILTFLAFILSSCSSNKTKLPEACYKVAKTGMCKAYYKKFYFNQKTNKCEVFIYGGCGGNIF